MQNILRHTIYSTRRRGKIYFELVQSGAPTYFLALSSDISGRTW